ncbi:MAG: Eco57I restriction-modification methylase domain-containing protein, partial [Treponema sp.]|nr:Eco57I restriction-modification methylase domain-containing protein [Treponema sp.]
EKVAELVSFYKKDCKNALEPAAGTGRFADAFPKSVDFTMFERDPESARINRLLHPDALVVNNEFQAQFFDPSGIVLNKKFVLPKYDLVVGNPPYGVYNDLYKGRGEGKAFGRYEEYFVSRGLDSLADGGLLAMVLPSSFFNSPVDSVKELIAGKCEIVDAYRLPEGVFPSTDVGTDIVLLRRGSCKAIDISGGFWFKEHPEKVMGVYKERLDRWKKPETYVALRDGQTPLDAVRSIAVSGPQVQEKKPVQDVPAGKKEIVSAPVSVSGEPLPEPGSLAVVPSFEADRKAELEKRRILREYEDKNGLFNKKKRLSALEFASFYSDGSIDPEEYEILTETEWDGSIDLSKLNPERLPVVEAYIEKSSKYVCTGRKDGKPVYENAIWYASGDIYARMDAAKASHEAGDLSDSEYEKCFGLLKASLPKPKTVNEISVSPISPLADDFKVKVQLYEPADASIGEQGDEDGLIMREEEFSLREAFVFWATGCGTRENQLLDYGKNGPSEIKDWSVAKIDRKEIPGGLAWVDIRNFVNKVPVARNKVYGHDDDAEEARQAADMKKRQDEDNRRFAAEKMFNHFLREGLSPADRDALALEWNRRFNSRVNADYSKLPFFVDGMNTWVGKKPFYLYRQQIRGVSFLTHKGNGLLAYDVGLGKTSCGIVATVSNMQAGRCKRPLIIVPLSVYDKWVDTFRAHFPDVPLLSLGNMRQYYSDFAQHYDAERHCLNIPEGTVSVATYQALDMVVFSKELWDEKTALEAGYSDAPLAEQFERIIGNADNAKKQKNIEYFLGTATKAANAAYIFWDLSGFDHVTVDEAHNFKNLYGRPRPQESRVDSGYSVLSNEFSGIAELEPKVRCIKLFAVTQLVQREHDRNVFLLTATPFVNNPVEVYTMLSYVALPALRACGVDRLYDFCVEFADCRSEWSVDKHGNIVLARVMKGFKNPGALHSLISEYIDKVGADEAGIERPFKYEFPSDSSGLPREIAEYGMTDLQKEIAEREKRRMASGDRLSAATLVGMTNMRKSLLSPVLCDVSQYPGLEDSFPGPDEFVTSSPKLRFVCDSAVRVWKAMPERGQIIYIPIGQEYFPKIIDYFETKGVPRNVFKMITGTTKGDDRAKIKDRFNDPKDPVKILIGTSAMSEGMDLNGNSVVIYLTQLDWNPTQRIQVIGRIWRQGNLQENVFVVTPYARNSIDSLFLQKHDEKASRIDSIFSYKEGQSIDLSDISPEDLKFDLITDPEVKADFFIGREVSKIEGEERIYSERVTALYEYLYQRGDKADDIIRNRSIVDEAQGFIDEYLANGYEKSSPSVQHQLNRIREAKAVIRRREKAVKSTDDKLRLEFEIDAGSGFISSDD